MSVTELYRMRAAICIISNGQNEIVYTLVTWMVIIKKNKKIPNGDGNFYGHKSFWPHYGLWVDTASNRNKCEEYFRGVKAASE
jgi:hypothetical protein